MGIVARKGRKGSKMANRVGLKVQPNQTYAHRPICKVISSTPAKYRGQRDTYHIVQYPDGQKNEIGVWESEWPGRFIVVNQVRHIG